MGVHEIEYGISVIPLLVFIIFLTNLKKIKFNNLNVIKIISVILMLMISLFILSLNILDNSLGNFFYKLPIIKSTWVNYRLTAIYIMPIIIMSSTLGMLIMISAYDLIVFYLGLELQSLCLYILASSYVFHINQHDLAVETFSFFYQT